MKTKLIKNFLKKTFSGVYDYRLHVLRQETLKKCEKLKKTDIETKKRILTDQYEKLIGHPINWDAPKTYTEKMQLYKLYDMNPQKVVLSDKYKVREWVSKKIGDNYLIPLLGVWKNYEDIDFDKLPDSFVLKTNNGSGTNLIVRDKRTINHKRASRMFSEWLLTDYAYVSNFEMHYSQIPPVIIAEKYIESMDGDLPDYKFICFDGQPYYCRVDMGRFKNHTRSVYNCDWELQDWNQGRFKNCPHMNKPESFGEMLDIAITLSKGFSHVRVDLYNVQGKVYFGEMTFTSGSGLEPNLPYESDLMLGNLWNLDIEF